MNETNNTLTHVGMNFSWEFDSQDDCRKLELSYQKLDGTWKACEQGSYSPNTTPEIAAEQYIQFYFGA
jgi:hypothetical protein